MKKITILPWFSITSWLITFLIVAGILAFAFWRLSIPMISAPTIPQVAPVQNTQVIPTSSAINISWLQLPSIERQLKLKTIIPKRPQYNVITRTVERGDAISRMAKEFNIKPDTLLFANYDILKDNPDGLRPGQELNVPPVDGILYQWKDGDQLDQVVAEFKAKVEDVLNWPGNSVDLTDPTIKPGQLIMIPGGTRESKAQTIETADGGGGGSTGCPSNGVSRGFFSWPADNHYLSGNDYSAGHPGIDIAASEGAPIYAADSGVVTMSQDGYNFGYGSVIQINHGKFTTLYAHLSARFVERCQVVGGGSQIGTAGNTGNSFGAHLHFEIRLGGGHVNPWDYLP